MDRKRELEQDATPDQRRDEDEDEARAQAKRPGNRRMDDIIELASAAPKDRSQARELYRQAIAAKNRHRWQEALALFRQAISLDPIDSGDRVNITGFGNIEPYLPHYYAGVALMHLGDARGALAEMELSEQHGGIQRSSLWKALQRDRDACRQAAPPIAP